MHMLRSSASLTTSTKQNLSPARTCISFRLESISPATHSPSSFHRQLSTPSPRALSARFRNSSILAPTNPTEKSISSPLLRSTSAIIAAQRSQAISRHLSTAASSSPPTMSYGKFEYQPRKIGALHTNEFRCYIEKDGVPLSPFHDIPLYANEQQTILNMVVEIPRWSNAKLEVCAT